MGCSKDLSAFENGVVIGATVATRLFVKICPSWVFND